MTLTGGPCTLSGAIDFVVLALPGLKVTSQHGGRVRGGQGNECAKGPSVKERMDEKYDQAHSCE